MKLFLSFVLPFSLLSSSLFGLTLQESVIEVMNTNPVVTERLKNYRATQQDLSIAESEYYPSVDFRASLGYNNGGSIKDSNNGSWDHQAVDSQYNNYETSLILTQNLFDGFSTTSKVNYQDARILAATYNYIEKLIHAITGWKTNLFELMKAGERRINLMRMFNAREGLTFENDKLPERCFEALDGGLSDGFKFDTENFSKALKSYYKMMNWNPETGVPTEGKLMELGLGWMNN